MKSPVTRPNPACRCHEGALVSPSTGGKLHRNPNVDACAGVHGCLERCHSWRVALVQAPTFGISDMDVHIRLNIRPCQTEQMWGPTSNKNIFTSAPHRRRRCRRPTFGHKALSHIAQEPQSHVQHTTRDPPHGHVHETDKPGTVNRVTHVHAVGLKARKKH